MEPGTDGEPRPRRQERPRAESCHPPEFLCIADTWANSCQGSCPAGMMTRLESAAVQSNSNSPLLERKSSYPGHRSAPGKGMLGCPVRNPSIVQYPSANLQPVRTCSPFWMGIESPPRRSQLCCPYSVRELLILHKDSRDLLVFV